LETKKVMQYGSEGRRERLEKREGKERKDYERKV
jgi:hypothetical protein